MQITTVQQFVEACKQLDSDAIYELFEFSISDSVRNEIYEKYSTADSNEPMRCAMNELGLAFNVQSLYDY